MALDRDLEVALLSSFRRSGSAPARGWEMLAATGVRGLRLMNEAGAPTELYLSERSARAVDVLRVNTANVAQGRAHPVFHDARWPLPLGPFDLVDLDPFGSPAPYFASALDCAGAGSLLGVAATDLAVFAGASRGACQRRYGSTPIRGYAASEGAIRILLAALSREAALRGVAISPVLSFAGDHHVRVYVRLRRPAEPPPVVSVKPENWTGAPIPGPGPWGPMWMGPIQEAEVVSNLEVGTSAAQPSQLGRLLGILREESTVSAPFFYEPNRLAQATGIPRPPPLGPLLAALRAAGAKVARSHLKPAAFRTDLPRAEVERIAVQTAGSAQSQNARVRA